MAVDVGWPTERVYTLQRETAEWFLSHEDKQELLKLLYLAKPKLLEVGRLGKMEVWLTSQ